MSKDKDISLIEHLRELRLRIIHSLSVVFIATLVCYGFSDFIMEKVQTIISPFIPMKKLVFISPVEAFLVSIKFSVFLGIIVSIPYCLYQFWSFVYVALYSKEKRFFNVLLFFSMTSFYLGILFSYKLVIPFAMKFLVTSTPFTPMISVDSFYSFIMYSSIIFGVIFQTPLIILTANKMNIVSLAFLKEFRRYAIIIIFLLAGIFSPPDILSQFLVAVPMLILFEIGLILCRIF